MKRKGFTLAETLITLAILGIIASILIPAVINNNKKRQTISRLKIAYEMLDSMTQQSYIENGYEPGANFDTYFKKYLNINIDCGREDTEGKCFKNGTFYTLDNIDRATTGNAYGNRTYRKVLLKNGMSLGFSDNAATYNGFAFIVDIDGPKKGDSKLGQDVFQFTYYAPHSRNTSSICQKPGLFLGSYGPGHTQGSTCNVSRQYLLNTCRDDKTSTVGTVPNAAPFPNGSGCSGLIIRDGWKISDDYPWSYAQKKP